MITSRETLWLFAGQVENRAELCERIGITMPRDGHDGVLAWHCYRRWGTDMVHYVLGAYGFTAIERRSRVVTFGRDSLGIGKLYYSAQGPSLHVSTSLPLILASLETNPRLDKNGLAEYLSQGDLGDRNTVYEGILLSPPGQSLRVANDGTTATISAWRPNLDKDLICADEGDYADRCRSLLFKAVSIAVERATGVCSELSGGLDSSTVTAVAARLDQNGALPGGLTSLSVIATESHRSDEREFQDAVVKMHSLNHVTVDADEYPAFGQFDGDLPAEPCSYLANTIMHSGVSRLANSLGADTCLTGHGGDVVFAGDDSSPWFLRDLMGQGHFIEWLRAIREFAGKKHSYAELLRISTGRCAVEPAQAGVWLQNDFRNLVLDIARDSLDDFVCGSDRPGRALQYALIRREAAHLRTIGPSWQQRYPLFYRPLVEFMLAVPWPQKVRPGIGRCLLRRAMDGIVPDVVRLRPGKVSPDAAFLRGLAKNWAAVRGLARGTHLADLSLIEPAIFTEECHRMRHGYVRWSTGFACLWGALTCELWLSLGGASRGDSERSRLLSLIGDLRREPGSVLQ